MKKLMLLINVLFISAFTYAQSINSDKNQLLIDGYVYGNVIDKSDVNLNSIYKRESVFTFSYSFLDKKGNELFFNINKDHSWDFINADQTKENVIKDFQLKILKGNINYKNPTYYQIGISYIINKNNVNSDMTGLIENDKNIWLHPPREYLFRILELNPFPYIKYPLKIGHTWSWKLQISDGWGDKRWKEWTGIVENNYKYSIVDKETIKTNIGNLDCFIIESEAVCELGKTRLTSYFNEKYGFVRLEYTNIDNSKLVIAIEGVEFQMFKYF